MSPLISNLFVIPEETVLKLLADARQRSNLEELLREISHFKNYRLCPDILDLCDSLGKGAHGSVLRLANPDHDGKWLAIKKMNADAKGDHEARMLRMCQGHVNVVELCFYVPSSGALILEYGGVSLRQLLEKRHNFSEQQLRWLARQLLEGPRVRLALLLP